MVVEFRRRLAGRILVFAFFLTWPLLLFGGPAYISDSAAYLKGGRVAVEYAADKFSQPAAATIEPAASTENASSIASEPSAQAQATGARAISYSVAAYLLRMPGLSLTGLAMMQILAAAFLCAVTATALGVKRERNFVLLAAILASTTSLPIFTAFAVPDIFSAILLGCAVLLTTKLDRLSAGIRISLVALAAFAITTHASHPPLAAGLLIVGSAYLWARSRKGEQHGWRRWGWAAAPLVIGAAATVGSGFIAFGEASVAPKHYPLALARSISDGPARWYLERQCVRPRYAVCEVFGTSIPDQVPPFLFGETGLDGRATPEQMDRIRAEEREIVVRAALAYPGLEVSTLSRNFLRQLGSVGFNAINFADTIGVDSAGNPRIVESRAAPLAMLTVLHFLFAAVLLVSIAWALAKFRNLATSDRSALLLLVTGILGNAVICVVFSGIAERYQSRIVWLIPLFVLSIALASRKLSDIELSQQAEKDHSQENVAAAA